MNIFNKKWINIDYWKGYLFILIILFISTNLYPMSPRREYLIIRNFSSHNVSVNMVFREGPGSNIETDVAWHQEMFGMVLSIKNMLAVINTNEIWPNENLQVISYFPLGPQLDDKYIQLYSLPFTDKMENIFNVFEIIHNGRVIISLDNIEEWIIQEWEGIFVLEIFNDNSESRIVERRRMIGEVSRTEADTNLNISNNILEAMLKWSIALSLPDGNIYLPENIPGYSYIERQALLMHLIQHQGSYQNDGPQEAFQQLIREFMLYYSHGIDVYETQNAPLWHLEYDAHRLQDRALRIQQEENRY